MPQQPATLIQRFGSALNLNVHFHMLFLDGVYIKDQSGRLRFKQLPKPSIESLQTLVHTISHRIARSLERKGLLERGIENSYLQLDGMEADTMQSLYGHSITYRRAQLLNGRNREDRTVLHSLMIVRNVLAGVVGEKNMNVRFAPRMR